MIAYQDYPISPVLIKKNPAWEQDVPIYLVTTRQGPLVLSIGLLTCDLRHPGFEEIAFHIGAKPNV